MKHLSFFCLMFAMVGINGQMAGMPEQHVNVFEKTLIKTQSLEKPSKAPDQGTIYFEEDFSGSGIYPPAGWTSTPAMNREWLMSSGVGNTTPRYGNRMATIDFSLLHPLDAWLFSPAITLTAGNRYEIGFWVHMPGSTATSLDQLKVQIAESTTVTDGAMDGDILYINTTTRIQTWTWITATYTAKTTGNHHIGFHAFNNTFTGSRISIDYVSVTDVPVVRTNDLALTAVDPFIFPYTQVPTGDLVQSVTWTPAAATVTNVGSTPQSNVNVALTLNGAPLATSSSVDILNPGASEVVTFNSQTFSAVNGQIETFNLTYTAQADLPDDDPSDNTVTYTAGTVIGTNYTFAQNATTIGTNNAIGNGGTRGNIFTITNEVTLGQVSVALGGTIVMVNYNVVLYKLKSDDDTIDGAALFTIAGQRPVSNTPWAWFNHLLPNNGFVLEPGRYFLGVNQPSTTGIILLADGTPRSGYSLNAANGDLTNTGHGAFAVTMGLKGAGLFLCSNPTELTVLETMPTSARFSWKGESGNYTFSLHNNATGALINQAIVTDPSSFSVSGLSVNTEYRWSVAANCAGNLSEAVWGTPFRTATNMTRYAVTAFVQGNGNNLTTTHSIGNITVQNRGTLQTSGTISIPATLEVNGVIVGRENITSTTTTNWAVNGNRTNYQFPTLRANLSAPGEHTVRVWLNHPADTTVPVDTFSKVIVNTVLDAGATEIVGYIDGDYTNLGATEMLKIKVKNHGPTKTHGFQVNASVNGIRLSPSNTVIWNFAAHALESGEEREYTFEQPLNLLQHDLGTTGTYVIRAWARHNTADLDASNDTVTVTITNTNYKDLEAVAITHPI
ncbi:MAG: choice-of-anchor J domain-containing protein, partial [Bacteroidales bacterium]|nr:choice-of-anchor J domain-containing protein [Bacteroidales bacterium]